MSMKYLNKRYSRLSLIAIFAMMMSVYCLYHLVQGPQGLLVSKRLELHNQYLSAELEKVQAERVALEDRVNRMRNSSIDTDMLEQQALYFLGPLDYAQVQLKSR